MNSYKHTQVGYLMLSVTLIVLVLFVWAYVTALAELASYDSGPNLLVTAVMILVIFLLVSFGTLTTFVDQEYLRVKFGYGIFQKRFSLNEIVSATSVKNHWYYGWGIRVWFWPKMWIYNVSGFDAVQINMRNGKIYRIGTDDPKGLETAINQAISNFAV